VSYCQWLSDFLIPVIYPISAVSMVEMNFDLDQSRLSFWLALMNLNLSQGIYIHTVRIQCISIMCNHTGSVSKVCYLFSEQEGKTDDIQELRNKIMEVLRQEPYMGEKIPVR